MTIQRYFIDSEYLPVILTGLPGAGKSKVGEKLASALCIPHLDTDALVVKEAGQSISEIFALEGEAGFREREERAVLHALTMEAVVSLGGGAVLTPGVREALRGHTVIHINASQEELLRRTSGEKHRPLLLPDVDTALRKLRSEREHLYREVLSVEVKSDWHPVSAVVSQILRQLSAFTEVSVDAHHPYRVSIGCNFNKQIFRDSIPEGATRALAIYPESVKSGAARITGFFEDCGITVTRFVHPDAEAGKTLDVAAQGWDAAGKSGLGRKDFIIGIGGGATTDLAGFIAATWLRGIKIIQVPTSLLGMVDAAVGGKTGINTSIGKNLVGSFHSPVHVFEDLTFLETLPPRDLIAGLGEVVKCGFIADKAILDLVERHHDECVDPSSSALMELITRSVSVKARVVGSDPQESGLREILNYGHTLAHAIERCENYEWRHGDAVAVGCVFAAELAYDCGFLTREDVDLHRDLLSSLGLPIEYSGAPLADLLHVMTSDKKVRQGQLRFVLLEGLQNPQVHVISPEQLLSPAQKIGIHP